MADISTNHFKWTLPDGNVSFKTISGAILTTCFFSVVLAYALSLFVVLWERSDYSDRLIVTENYFTEDKFALGKEDGFVVAATLYSNYTLLPDPEIGELKFYML